MMKMMSNFQPEETILKKSSKNLMVRLGKKNQQKMMNENHELRWDGVFRQGTEIDLDDDEEDVSSDYHQEDFDSQD